MAPTDLPAMPSLSRRRFLQGLVGTGVAAPFLRPVTVWADADGVDHTMVYVFLTGGLDGCSVLVPRDSAAYVDARPTTVVPGNVLLDVDDTFGLHPAMADLHRHVLAGRVAFVPAAGSQLRSRSHFAMTDHVDAGGVDGVESGWLARHLLSRTGSATDALDAVAIRLTPPNSLAGARQTVSIDQLADFGIDGYSPESASNAENALRALYQPSSTDPRLADNAVQLFETLSVLDAAAPADIPAAATYPRGPFGRQLSQIAQLIKADVGVDVATAEMVGFDTHIDMGTWEAGRMRSLLTEASQALAAFLDDLGSLRDRVTVVVQSEFGRRVAENGSGGTDHGTGGLMMVLGDRVNGGVHGPWPGLTADVLEDGDLPVATDFRHVLSEVLIRQQQRADVAAVFPGFTPEFLGITA